MKKTILMALTALPLAAFAQGPGPGPGTGMGPGQGQGQGPGRGRHVMAKGEGRGDPERMEKRMRLARTLGLAEALDLEPAEALKLGETIGKFDEKRLAAHRQLHEAHQALRKAAQGEKATAAEVDQAIQKGAEARAQLQAIDRDIVAAVTKGLDPEKKARAVLFLERFQGRFGPTGMGSGPMRVIRKRMMGPDGPGMGPGPGGPGPTGKMSPEEMEMRMEMELMAGHCMGPECELDED